MDKGYKGSSEINSIRIRFVNLLVVSLGTLVKNRTQNERWLESANRP
jgi:hypothetical protein